MDRRGIQEQDVWYEILENELIFDTANERMPSFSMVGLLSAVYGTESKSPWSFFSLGL